MFGIFRWVLFVDVREIKVGVDEEGFIYLVFEVFEVFDFLEF